MMTKILAVTMVAGLGYGGLYVYKGDCCSNGSTCPTGSCNVLDASCCARPATTDNADEKPDCCYPGSPCCYPGSPCCGDATTSEVVKPDCCYPGSPCCYPGSPCCSGSCCPDGACCPDGPCCAVATTSPAAKSDCCSEAKKCCGSKK